MGVSGSADRGRVLGRYVLIEELGAGAMGVVYAALDPDLHRKIALKLLRVDKGANIQNPNRLLEEAQAMARLNHPNVVKVHDVGTLDDGRVYLAMEFIDGITLREWYRKGPHPIDEVIDVIGQAAVGLHEAHQAGLVHRDFKPDNVMLDGNNRARVLDFGLAYVEPQMDSTESPSRELLESDLSNPSDEISGEREKMILGTPAYMAPEQHRGQDVDTRADQFALAVVLFEGLYGGRPFRGRTRQAIAMRMLRGKVEEAPVSRGVPAWQHKVLLRALRSRPEERYPSVDAFMRALRTDPRQRRRAWIAGGALATAAAAGGAAILAFAPEPQRADCSAEVERIDAAWPPAPTDPVEVAESPAWLEGSRAVVDARLERRATQWREIAADTCEKASGKSATAELADARRACLDDRLTEIRIVAKLAHERGHTFGRELYRLGSSLPDPGQCVGATHSDAKRPSPEVAGWLLTAELLAPHDPDLARDFAARARERAPEDPSVIFAARYADALADLADDAALGRISLHALAAEASTGGDARYASKAWLALAASPGPQAAVPGTTWFTLAEASATGLGDTDPSLRLQLARAKARAATHDGTDAAASWRAVVELAEAAPSLAELELAADRIELGRALVASGEVEAAALQLDTAEADLAPLGPEHPARIGIALARGEMDLVAGRPRSAIARARRGLELASLEADEKAALYGQRARGFVAVEEMERAREAMDAALEVAKDEALVARLKAIELEVPNADADPEGPSPG